MHLKKITTLLFFASLFFAFRSQTLADFNGLKAEYSQKLVEHGAALSEYNVAKNTYETYQTLSSLTQVLQKSKNYLKVRDELVIKHFELLNAKIDEMEFTDPKIKESQKEIISSEISFFQSHLSLLQGVATVQDINTVSEKAEDEIKLANIKSKQILGNILTAKVNLIKVPYTNLTNKISEEIAAIKSKGLKPKTSVEKLERWLVEVNNKKILSDNNTAQNLNDLTELSKDNNQDIEKQFDTIRINIIQGYLYLKEGTGYMKEILNEIKYE